MNKYGGFAVVGIWRQHLLAPSLFRRGLGSLDRLLPMLTSMVRTPRVGFLGWLMGDTALLLGARLDSARTAGIWPSARHSSFTGSTPGAFDSASTTCATQRVGPAALNSIPLRVDCGASDRFYFAAPIRQSTAQPPAGGFSPGGYDASYWREQLPADLGWRPS